MNEITFKYTDRFDRKWIIYCDTPESDIEIISGYDIDTINAELAKVCDAYIAHFLSYGSRYRYLLFDDDNIYICNIRHDIYKKDNKYHIDEVTASLVITTTEERIRIKEELDEKNKREKEEAERYAREYNEYISKYLNAYYIPKYKYKNNTHRSKTLKYGYDPDTKLFRWQNNLGEVKRTYYFGGCTDLKKLTQEFDNLVDNVLTKEDIAYIANHSIYGEAYFRSMQKINRLTKHKRMIKKPSYNDIMKEFRYMLSYYITKGVKIDPIIIAIFNLEVEKNNG